MLRLGHVTGRESHVFEAAEDDFQIAGILLPPWSEVSSDDDVHQCSCWLDQRRAYWRIKSLFFEHVERCVRDNVARVAQCAALSFSKAI